MPLHQRAVGVLGANVAVATPERVGEAETYLGEKWEDGRGGCAQAAVGWQRRWMRDVCVGGEKKKSKGKKNGKKAAEPERRFINPSGLSGPRGEPDYRQLEPDLFFKGWFNYTTWRLSSQSEARMWSRDRREPPTLCRPVRCSAPEQ